MRNSSQLILPFAEREYVDVARCGRILGVSWTTVHRLAATVGFDNQPLISMVEYRRAARKRILYASIVRFCDKLREKYSIADRRPLLTNPLFRHRDEDLLPFPLNDTITTADAAQALGYEYTMPVMRSIEEGCFEAYRMVPDNPWRISLSSFIAFMDAARNRPSQAAQPYKRYARPRVAQTSR